MKNSIVAKTLWIIAAVILIADSVLLVMGYNWIYSTTGFMFSTYANYSAQIVASDLDGVDIDELKTNKEYYNLYYEVFNEVCKNSKLKYVYLYVPNVEDNTIQYLMIAYNDPKDKAVLEDKKYYTDYPYTLTDTEKKVFSGEENGDNQTETDNKYGHVYSSCRAVTDENGKIVALLSVDLSTEIVSSVSERNFIKIGITVLVSLIFILAIIAIILKVKILKPAKIISTQMLNFVSSQPYTVDKIQIKGHDEFSDMANTFNYMMTQIDDYINNIKNLSEEKRNQQAEINVAAKIQSGFLPDKYSVKDGIRTSAVMIPAKYIGGDFYDYFDIDEKHFCTLIADVSGKGLTAAMLMSGAIIMIRQYAKFGYSPSQILCSTNNSICKGNNESMFITVFVGIYNKETMEYTYSNAGHNIPYIISKNSSLQPLDGAGGLPVGLFKDEVYNETSIKLYADDTVFMYTDGVNEAANVNNELFTTKRLEKLLNQYGSVQQEKCVDIVLKSIKEFTGNAVQSDDITMLAFCVENQNTITVAAELKSLPQVQNIIRSNAALDIKTKKQLCLAAEEIFVNICSYSYPDETGEVEIMFTVTSDKVLLRFCDSGQPYNPIDNNTNIDEYDMQAQEGGLGKFLAFSFVDNAEYHYENNKNILTLTKFI